MSAGEIAGYVACLLTFATFYTRTMVMLRYLAISSNVAFLTYALPLGLTPVAFLHAFLLPLNIIRLQQFKKLLQETKGKPSLRALAPLMRPLSLQVGDRLFSRGDKADAVYYVVDGRLRVLETGQVFSADDSVGVFALLTQEKQRVVTVVAETESNLRYMPEQEFLQHFAQNPRFGYQVLRSFAKVIKGYLQHEHDPGVRAVAEEMNSRTTLEDSPPKNGNSTSDRGAAAPPATGTASWSGRLFGTRWRKALTGAVLLLAGVFLAGTYLRSLLVRDGVVTSWTNLATAPVGGSIKYIVDTPGDSVGPDGRLAEIENRQLTHASEDAARVEVDRARARVEEARRHLAALQALDTTRSELSARYAEQFRAMLAAEAENLRAEVASTQAELVVLNKISTRKQKLAARSTIAQDEADEAQARVLQIETRLAGLRMKLGNLLARAEASTERTFVTRLDDFPDWVLESLVELELAQASAARDLHHAEIALASAEAALNAATADFLRVDAAVVTAPSGSILWKRTLPSGSFVLMGGRIAEWVDCTKLLVAVPVFDVELALLKPGDQARVKVDGEPAWIEGKVLSTRDTSSAFGPEDLVSVPVSAKAGWGEAVVDISAARESFPACPIGRSAFVDFPQAGWPDLLQTWLRL